MKLVAILIALSIQLSLLLPPAYADPSNTLVVDKQGRVYFGDVLHNVVWKIADGKLAPFIKDKHSHRVVLDEQGNLFGEHLEYVPSNDSWRFHMWKATPTGEVSYVVPPSPGFPLGLLMDNAGNRYEWHGNNNKKDDSRIVKRLPDGTLVTIAGQGWGWADGKGEQAKFGSIGGMAWGPDGALYVTDIVSVRKITLDGQVTTIIRGGPEMKPGLKSRLLSGGSGNLFGLTLDAQSNIYAANFGGSKLVKISPTGKVLAVIPSESGWAPTGVAVANGDIYVLEYQNLLLHNNAKGPRVRKVFADGTAVTLGTVGEASAAITGTSDAPRAEMAGWIKWGMALLVTVAITISARRVWRFICEPKEKQVGTSF